MTRGTTPHSVLATEGAVGPAIGKPRLPTLAEAMASAGVGGAPTVAASVARGMPPGGTVARRLGIDDRPTGWAAETWPDDLATHGRVVGSFGGFTFVAFRDALVSLRREMGDTATRIRSVSSGREAVGAASLRELAALAGDRLLDDREIEAFGGEPTHPAWIETTDRIRDLLVASPGAGVGSVEVGEPVAPGGPARCRPSRKGVGSPGTRRDLVRMIVHAIGIMPRIGAMRLRPGAHAGLASSWDGTGAVARVRRPGPAGAKSAVIAAATTRAARARTLAWLVDAGADADLVGRVRGEWGMEASDGVGDNGGAG